MSYKMRQIELKNIKKGEDGATDDLNYREILKACLEAPANPQAGCTTAETRKVIPILDELEKAEDGDTIQVTESQWTEIKARIKNLKMRANRRCMVEFEDDIQNAEEIDMVPAESKQTRKKDKPTH